MPEIFRPTPDIENNHIIKDIAIAGGATAFLIALSNFGFSSLIKDFIWKKQNGECGDPGCNRDIYEYHHVVPENAFRKRGIRGKNTEDNAVGLCYEHHKNKWDLLMFKNIFFPGVPLDQLDPSTYNGNFHERKPKKFRHRKGRR